MGSDTCKTGKDLHEALLKGCIENCRECGLRTPANTCLLKDREKWEDFAKSERMRFQEVLNA